MVHCVWSGRHGLWCTVCVGALCVCGLVDMVCGALCVWSGRHGLWCTVCVGALCVCGLVDMVCGAVCVVW